MSSTRLADRLNAARRQRFVGRGAELGLLQSTLAARELPFQLLYIYGPGAVGKTTLLSEFVHQCEKAGPRRPTYPNRYQVEELGPNLDAAPVPATQDAS